MIINLLATWIPALGIAFLGVLKPWAIRAKIERIDRDRRRRSLGLSRTPVSGKTD
jgi:hypothetical protein